MSIATRLQEIRERIAAAASQAGRDPSSVRLVAVCKRQPIERIFDACDAGVEELGENTVQGLAATATQLEQTKRTVRWHFIGSLQRNKVGALLRYTPTIHSVDRMELATALSRRGPEGGVDLLVQVNIGREPQKGGVDPDNAVDLACQISALPGVRLRGLMAIPPFDQEPRPHFESLARLAEQLRSTAEGREATELSIGMSDDFETAIDCGATIVRVGTGLFGPREARA